VPARPVPDPAEAPGVLRIHHVGVVVRDAARAAEAYQRGLGLATLAAEERPGVSRVAFVEVGETRLELIEPIGEASPWAEALRSRGEGAHHVALEVADLPQAIAALDARGVRFLDRRPRREAGSVLSVFLDPGATGGTLIELVQQIRSAR